jgi:flagellar assembly factor FliW
MNITDRVTCRSCGRTCNRNVLPALYCSDTYYFTEGFPGFEDLRGVSARCQPELEPFFLLEALPPSDLFLVCIDPFLICPDYEPRLSANDLAHLGLTHADAAVFAVPVSLSPDMTSATANLRGPLVFNRRTGLAKQTDCGHAQQSVQFPIPQAFHVHRRPVFETPCEPPSIAHMTGPACSLDTAV